MNQQGIHPKVAAATIIGALTTIVVAILHSQAHFDPTVAEVAAGTTLLMAVAGYLKLS